MLSTRIERIRGGVPRGLSLIKEAALRPEWLKVGGIGGIGKVGGFGGVGEVGEIGGIGGVGGIGRAQGGSERSGRLRGLGWDLIGIYIKKEGCARNECFFATLFILYINNVNFRESSFTLK